MIDFAYLRLYLPGGSNPYPNWKVAGDLNVDSNINAIDYAILRSFLLGNINTLPYKPDAFYARNSSAAFSPITKYSR